MLYKKKYNKHMKAKGYREFIVDNLQCNNKPIFKESASFNYGNFLKWLNAIEQQSSNCINI